MPARNSRKQYLAKGYYHLYNRGVEKRVIFKDRQDYAVFLSYLKTYLSPKDKDGLQKHLLNSNLRWEDRNKILKQLQLNNFADEISLLAYCLMPNHFHLLLKQKSSDGIDRFMNSLGTRYVMYFNKKHDRVGPLYQGTYKAVLVDSDEQLIHLSAYIHKNPYELKSKSNQAQQGVALENLTRQPSSLPEYLGKRKTKWINSNEILSFFSKKNHILSYENFALGYSMPSPIIGPLIIE